MKQQSLGEIAELMSGQAFRGSLQDDPSGDYCVLNSKSVKNGYIDYGELVRISTVIKQPFKFVETGDILVCAKTTQHSAYVFESQQMKTVASSYFQIVRINNKDNLLPDYLAWFINHPDSQQALSQLATGTTVKNLKKSVLDSFAITIPSIENQLHVIETATCVTEKLQILKELQLETDRYWSRILMNGVLECVV